MAQSKSALKEAGFQGNLSDSQHNLLTFKEFNQESVKSKVSNDLYKWLLYIGMEIW